MTASPPFPRRGSERSRLRGPAAGFLAAVLVAGVVVAVSAAAVPGSARAGVVVGGAVLAVLCGGAVAVAVHGVRSARWHRAEAESMSGDADRLLRERDGLARELGSERHRLTDEYTRRIAARADEHAHHVATLSEEGTLRIAALEDGHERLLAKLSEEHAGRIATLGE